MEIRQKICFYIKHLQKKKHLENYCLSYFINQIFV